MFDSASMIVFRIAILLTAFTSVMVMSSGDEFRVSAEDSPVKSVSIAHLVNVYALGSNLFSGSSPEADEAFAQLAKLGVKTMISVDGKRPNIEAARRHGIRYVHLPSGYDRIDLAVQHKLIKAAQTMPAPIYIHCHHGQHRGPAAAAVIRMGAAGWSRSQAEAWLKMAGTGTNYAGLYQAVREFRRPAIEELNAIPSELPETGSVSRFVDIMVQIEDRWDHLKAIRKAGYRGSQHHPDIEPAHEAVILQEHYREAQRIPDSAHHGEKFLGLLKTAEAGAIEAENLLRQFAADPNPEIRAKLDHTFGLLAQSCSSCHESYRDVADVKLQP
jgi:hypothetical protein